MKELPKNRLTMQETWIEGDYLSTLKKESKKAYKSLTIQEKRDALTDYVKNKNSKTMQADEINNIPNIFIISD